MTSALPEALKIHTEISEHAGRNTAILAFTQAAGTNGADREP